MLSFFKCQMIRKYKKVEYYNVAVLRYTILRCDSADCSSHVIQNRRLVVSKVGYFPTQGSHILLCSILRTFPTGAYIQDQGLKHRGMYLIYRSVGRETERMKYSHYGGDFLPYPHSPTEFPHSLCLNVRHMKTKQMKILFLHFSCELNFVYKSAHT